MPFPQQVQGYQDTMVPFGPWMPDEDANIKPGYPLFWVNGSPVDLDDAKNVLWTAGAYRPWNAPQEASTAVPATPTAAVYFTREDGSPFVVAGTATALYATDNYSQAWTQAGSGYTGSAWQFAQYGGCVYATNGADPIQTTSVDGTPAFTALSANAPVCKTLGVIRDFVVAGNIVSSPIGNTVGPNVISWCGLAAPATWDSENTQQARADQSGSQSLETQYGAVTYIADGESMGLVFQQSGIVRVQYVGGDVVFSFYTFERKRGLSCPTAAAQVGNTVFFLAADGFYATDGSSVQPVGYGKVNRWFLADCSDTMNVRAAVDTVSQCVVWSYPTANTSSGWRQVAYNYAEGNWSHADYACPVMFQGMNAMQYETQFFDASNKANRFLGAPTDCEVTTKFFRFDPSHRSMIISLRPMVDNPSTTAGVAAIAQDSDTATFQGYGSPEPISRQVSVRADGYAHAINVRIPGAFTYCQGIGIKYALRGSR